MCYLNCNTSIVILAIWPQMWNKIWNEMKWYQKKLPNYSHIILVVSLVFHLLVVMISVYQHIFASNVQLNSL